MLKREVKPVSGRRGAWMLALAGVLAMGQQAVTQPERFEGLPIASVSFDPPSQPVDSRDLAKIVTLKPGDVFHAADAGRVIDGLFETGYYEDIQVDATPQGNQIVLRIITQNAWFIGHITVDGKIKAPPDRAQLGDATRLELGTQFRPEDIQQAQDNLHRLLERNGLYDHELRIETEDHPEILERDIKLILDVGPRARYDTPNIQGDTKLPDNVIIRATGWKVRFIGRWRQVTQDRTRRGIAGVLKKYQKEERLTAEVRAGTPEYNSEVHRLKPTLDINAGPKVKVDSVQDKVSKRILKRYVPVFDEQTVNRDLLVEGQRNLRDYLQSAGYFEAEVEFRERQDDSDHLTIEYVIGRGSRHKLVAVMIKGNRYFTEEDLRERMFLRPATLIRFRHGRYSEAFVKQDIDSISNLYKSNGFRDVKVTPVIEDDYKGKTGEIAITLNIEEGRQWFVSRLTISGINTLDAQMIRAQLNAVEGQPYSETEVAADRNAILTAYQSAGFPDANFQWSMSPAPEPNRVELEYTVTEGRRQFIRNILLSGIQHTRMGLVNRNLKLKPDQPLSLVQMSEVQRTLYQLGIFSRIDMAAQNPNGKVEHKYVLYDFQEGSRYSLAIGVGAEVARIGGTTTNLQGAGGSTGFSPRFSMDVSRLNFLGLGHTVTLRGRVSNLEQLASFNYLAPRFRNVDGRNITFTTLYDFTRDVTTFSSKREEASIQLSQQVSKPSNILLRFAYRRVTTSDVVIPALLIPQLLQPVRIGILSTNYVQDRRDNPADAHRGIYNTVDLGVASNIFGSQRSFVRSLFRNATYHRLTTTLVLARETSFGAILPFSVPPGLTAEESIPLPERFFGGGSQTHRGFPENQAGPRDIGTPAGPGGQGSPPTGFPLGGNALLFNNIELRFPLIGDNIGGVLFHDAGNIYPSVSKISFRASQRGLSDFDYMVHAVGFGIRYKTPVGPVRLDLAYSINPPSYLGFKGTIQDLLTCGPNNTNPVCQPVQNNISHFQFFFSIGQTF